MKDEIKKIIEEINAKAINEHKDDLRVKFDFIDDEVVDCLDVAFTLGEFKEEWFVIRINLKDYNWRICEHYGCYDYTPENFMNLFIEKLKCLINEKKLSTYFNR